jgi:hypothetical protein
MGDRARSPPASLAQSPLKKPQRNSPFDDTMYMIQYVIHESCRDRQERGHRVGNVRGRHADGRYIFSIISLTKSNGDARTATSMLVQQLDWTAG